MIDELDRTSSLKLSWRLEGGVQEGTEDQHHGQTANKILVEDDCVPRTRTGTVCAIAPPPALEKLDLWIGLC